MTLVLQAEHELKDTPQSVELLGVVESLQTIWWRCSLPWLSNFVQEASHSLQELLEQRHHLSWWSIHLDGPRGMLWQILAHLLGSNHVLHVGITDKLVNLLHE